MAVQIATWFMDERVAFTNDDFVLFALEYYYQHVAPRRTRSTAWQGPSIGMTVDFKKRWGFTTKKARVSHIAANPNLEEQMITYRAECAAWMERVGRKRFFNFDETFWRLLQNCLQCWGVRGSPIRLPTKNNEKAGMTLGFTISASGKCLPILLIGKGKTQACLKKYMIKQHKGKVVATWSTKGWSTKQTMLFYLENVLIPYTKGKLSCMTWDTYGSHLDEDVVRFAMNNNIHIIPTPPGGTAQGKYAFFIFYSY